MTLILRKSSAQARIEGLTRLDWGDDDYAVIDNETSVGRIYKDQILGRMKWRWFLQVVPATPPNTGVTVTVEQAMAGFKERYEQVKARRQQFGGERLPVPDRRGR